MFDRMLGEQVYELVLKSIIVIHHSKDSNVFDTDMKQMRNVKVSMKIVNGKIVYTK